MKLICITQMLYIMDFIEYGVYIIHRSLADQAGVSMAHEDNLKYVYWIHTFFSKTGGFNVEFQLPSADLEFSEFSADLDNLEFSWFYIFKRESIQSDILPCSHWIFRISSTAIFEVAPPGIECLFISQSSSKITERTSLCLRFEQM